MDFERLGHTLDATQALRIMADVAGRQIQKVHAEIEKANREILKGNAEIERLSQMINALESRLAEARAECGVYEAHTAGLKAQVKVLEAEVMRVVPHSPLLARTGKTYPRGGAQTRLSTHFDAAFDAKARELGLPDSVRARRTAK